MNPLFADVLKNPPSRADSLSALYISYNSDQWFFILYAQYDFLSIVVEILKTGNVFSMEIIF